jgi:multiple sugar transport system permease protein
MSLMSSRALASGERNGAWRRSFRKYWPAYMFILPNFLGVLIFIAFPVVLALYMSFQEWDGVTAPHFVGLGNFHEIFADSIFWLSLRNTALYTLLTVPTGIAFSLGVAALLNQRVRGMAFFRAVIFVPAVMSLLAIAVIWKWLFDYNNGLINDVLSLLNLSQIPWLSDPAWALIGLAIIGVWQSFGLTSIILLAALQAVPESLLEAAAIDGAGPWRRFWSIMVPLIAPAILFVAITSFITSFQVFVQALYMTGGGPDYGTTVLNLLVFQRAFQQNRFGAASALAYILFAIIFAVTMVQLRVGRGMTNVASEFEV